ncbi:Predicted phosphoesterase, NUDIX family [Marinitoga hydrogenitolerans DSM 16785]|uniref:Predicted phosphoesterase, NUDIX family n=1 Tax=Marinitoga hydrogenitolerans (strain DSM 16785 / JCM 12826 / AT1271) TaxID=1122195 RepID=A0A1M4T0Y8_MARH1|nr:NUDIX domain-containing protein [Marinitoga hydrogenitolerans]SHE38133.1 Predicted phosphoesterase, NUDIX family [Marinitoga hydrogenitolerans DSM 16785]
MKEKVWVIDNEILNGINFYNGFTIVEQNILEKIFKNGYFIDRVLAENDESKKQIIPYVVIKNEKNEILVVQRTQKQTEKRLHNLYSVGIGGHINPIDKNENPELTFYNGLNRELNEELDIENLNSLEYVGLILDNSTEVSRVHLGVLFIAYVTNADIKEKENFKELWLKETEFKKFNGEFEGWSKIALRALEVI